MSLQALGASAPAVFSFDSSFSIRVIQRDGDPWFVAADICAALGIVNSRDAIAKLDADEKSQVVDPATVGLTDGTGINNLLNLVNESGMYTLILRCRDATKPGTLPHRFRKWMTSEVLPSIRKTGRYEAAQTPVEQPSPQLTANDHSNIQRVVWVIAHQMGYEKCWIAAVWHALRQATNCPAPNRFQERHIPAIVTELRRILEIVSAFREHRITLELDLARRIVRGREDAAPFIAQLQASEAAWLNEAKPWIGKITDREQKDLDTLALRGPAGGWDSRGCAESQVAA